MDFYDGKYRNDAISCTECLVNELFSITDNELCYDSQSVPLCPSAADYEVLLYCCIEDGAAICCDEQQKISSLVGVK